MGNCCLHGLDYRELVPVQEAAGDRGERQIYNLENVVGCLGKKLASSNSSQSWQRVNFYMPRIVVGALLSKNSSSGSNYNNINGNELESCTCCQPWSRCFTNAPMCEATFHLTEGAVGFKEVNSHLQG